MNISKLGVGFTVVVFGHCVYDEIKGLSDVQQVPLSAVQLSQSSTTTVTAPRSQVYDTNLDEPRSVLGDASGRTTTFKST